MKYLINLFSAFALFILVSLVFHQCATVSRPGGGDKDTIPPYVVYADPPFYTTNFNEKRVDIGFNEYVRLDKVKQQLIISPPMKKNPDIWIKGKGIYFELKKDELIDSATYIFNFGNAIVDNNEGNPYRNFSYVFSTGSAIDSFGVSGKLIEAFTLKPSKETFSIMLFDQLGDSVPLKERPKYVGRTLEDGSYEINHIKPGTYRLFALKESNGNFMYDHPSETIGFSDSLITIDTSLFSFHEAVTDLTVPDSIQSDSLLLAVDSLLTDSLNPSVADIPLETGFKIYGLFCDMVFFKEASTDTLQQLKKSGYIDNQMLYFSFKREITDSFHVELRYFPEKSNWFIPEYSIKRDSVNYWITDTALTSLDTLNVIVSYVKPDSMLLPVLVKDTLKFRKTRTIATRKKLFDDNAGEEKKEYLQLKFNVANNKQAELNDKLFIDFKTPVFNIDTSRIRFYKRVDTLLVSKKYEIMADSIKMNRLHFQFDLEEDSRYKIEIIDSAFADLYGLCNDTTYHNFSSKRMDQYGLLTVAMEGVEDQVIIELLSKDEKVVDSKIIQQDKTVEFKYIKPAEYKIKVIFDANRNGIWDTGNYLDKRQPEKVEYYTTLINIRENWDHAEKWNLKKPELSTETKTEENPETPPLTPNNRRELKNTDSRRPGIGR